MVWWCTNISNAEAQPALDASHYMRKDGTGSLTARGARPHGSHPQGLTKVNEPRTVYVRVVGTWKLGPLTREK